MSGLGYHAGFWSRVWSRTRSQAVYLWIALGYLAVQLALKAAFPEMAIASPESVVLATLVSLLMLLLALVCHQFMRVVFYQRPKHPVLQLLRNVSDVLRDREAMAIGLPVLLSLLIFIQAFSALKANIPVLQPMVWDQTLDRWDAALHFGRRPWEWLQPVLGHWPVTLFLNVCYHLWFIVMLCTWLHYAFLTPTGIVRTRFLLAFLLVWIVEGSVVATLLASAGPCYFGAGRLGLSPDPYQGLMAYLREANETVPIWAVPVQDAWWALHRAGSAEAGISAMPSLHNGTALLFALASKGWPTWVRRLLWTNVVVIFLGSVHLGWHYAVDGYVAWLLTLAIWQAALPLAGWKLKKPAAARRVPPSESPATLSRRIGVG